MKNIIEVAKRQPSTVAVLILLILSYAFNIYASDLLTRSYQESLFPVPYFEAQLSFDAQRIKEWYGFLIEHNTLDKYLQTQHIDYLFMLSVLLLHFFALLFVSRLFPSASRWRRGLIICALISSLAPIADGLENLVSYVMLADPLEFSSYLAILYSSFAALKFAMFIFAYTALAVGLLAALIMFLYAMTQRRI